MSRRNSVWNDAKHSSGSTRRRSSLATESTRSKLATAGENARARRREGRARAREVEHTHRRCEGGAAARTSARPLDFDGGADAVDNLDKVEQQLGVLEDARGVWFVELETLGSVVVLIIHRRLGRGRRPGSGFHARGMITALGIPRLFQRFLRSGDRDHVLLAARHLDEDRAAARSHRARIERVVARFGCRRALDERGRPLVCARRRLKPRPPHVESEAPDDDVPDRDRGEQRQDERGQRERGSREAASLAPVGCDAPDTAEEALAARLAERPAMAGAARRAARVRRRRECDAARRAQPRPRAQLHPDHGNRPAARALRRAGKSCTCFCIFCTCSSVTCRPCGVGRPRPGTPTATRTCWTPDYPRRREPR